MVPGITGSGKTHWASHALVDPAPRIALFTPHMVGADGRIHYRVGFYTEPPRGPALKWGVHCPYTNNTGERGRRNVFRDAFRAAFARFADAVISRREPFALIDEVHVIDALGAGDTLDLLATQAQNTGTALVYITQRAYAVPLATRSQTSDIVSFQQTHKYDVDALEMTVPGVFKGRVEHLKRGQFIHAKVRL